MTQVTPFVEREFDSYLNQDWSSALNYASNPHDCVREIPNYELRTTNYELTFVEGVAHVAHLSSSGQTASNTWERAIALLEQKRKISSITQFHRSHALVRRNHR